MMLVLAIVIDHKNYYLDNYNDDKLLVIDIQLMEANLMNHWMMLVQDKDVDEYDDDDV
jgi:hypothetical protein